MGSSSLRLGRLVVLLAIAGGVPTLSSAQALAESIDRQSKSSQQIAALSVVTHDTGKAVATLPGNGSAGRSKGHAMRWGIAIGIGAGVAVAGASAARYGENEGGRFCGACFIRWSAISVPAGAGIGAAVGFLIDRARR
jgi:hypothetical protein